MLIEGDPYRTATAIQPVAVRGAILSISTIWQMPVIFSKSVQDSAAIFQVLSGQLEKSQLIAPQRTILRPKKIVNRQLHILQGLPGVGARLSKRLLRRFKSVAGVCSAGAEELAQVTGMGAIKARKIREALEAEVNDFM